MKDLDFDELDRAVNSLMTNVPKSDTPEPEEAEKTLEITPTVPSEPAPAPHAKDAHMPLPSPSPVARPSSPRPPLAARRGGRFMDVVHPSSDMKTTATVPARPNVSRQGATITPSQSSVVATPSPKPSEPQPAAVKKDEDLATSAPAHDWPDPLELVDFKSDAATPEAPKEEPVKDAVELDTESSPLTSPFLSGTKVEKRPLGGSSAPEPDHAPAFGAEADNEGTIHDPEAQLPAKPEEVEAELPEELKGDLMAVEADTTTHQSKKPEEAVKPPEEKPVQKPAQASTETPAKASLSDEKLLPAGPTSISQQYREEPSTGDKDSGAIYDTDTYHQPLAHPAKQKPGWLWVVWIVIILVIGAAGGAALYFLGIV